MQANPIARDKKGDTPLHLAFLQGHEHVVRAFLSCGMADCNILNDKGETPLHIAAAKGNNSLIHPLINEMQADPVARDKQKNTPLHLACVHGHLKTVRALLSCGRVEFDLKNVAGMTPIQVATTSEIKDEMCKYRDMAKNTLDPFMKLFVIGNSGAGKSTLIEALRKGFPTVAKLISKPNVRTATKPESCTSGIIPHMCPYSSRIGNILIYDFAGQDKHYTSHSTVLFHSTSYSPPVFLLVVKITEKMEKIEKAVTKWLNFIIHYSLKAKGDAKALKVMTPIQPQLLIIASHVDNLSQGNDQERIQNQIIEVARNLQVGHYDFSGKIIYLDYRYPRSAGIEELFMQLQTVKQQCSLSDIKVDVGCRFLHGYLTENETKAISVASLSEDVKNREVLLPSNPSSLFELASKLNETGHILLLKSDDKHEESWIVTDNFRGLLLCDVIGSLPKIANQSSAAQPDRQCFCILSHSELHERFVKINNGSDTELILKLMIHLEFCHIVEQTNFKCLELNGEDKYYYFPQWHDVSKDKPDRSGQKWELDGDIKIGWYLECVNGSKLRPKLVYFLLQQLVNFLFRLDEHERKGFTIWQKGLRWTGNSIKTVVEVGKLNESVVVLASCQSDCKVKCTQHWTSIINHILDFSCCDQVEVKESLIPPEKVAYQVETAHADLLPLEYLAKRSLIVTSENETTITCGENENLIDSSNVFNKVFDPYYGLDKNKLWKLFREVKTERDDFLETIADLMYKTNISFEATGGEVTLQMKQFKHSNPSECLEILHRLTDKGKEIHIMQKLQRKLNECSILYRQLETLVMTVDHPSKCSDSS